jgi:hypothetical protein
MSTIASVVQKQLEREVVKFTLSILFFLILLGASLLYRPAPVQSQSLACPLTGGIIVEFGEEIRSDRSEAEAQAGPVNASLSAGTYRVTLVSYDDHTVRPHEDQPAEQWYLIFQSNGETVASSSSIRDLPSDQDWLIQVVDFYLVVPQDVTSLVAFHTVFPDNSSPNSVTPACATLHRRDEQRPTATPIDTVMPTGSPMPTASPTPTPEQPSGVTGTPTATLSPTPEMRMTATPSPTFTPTPDVKTETACARFNLEQGRSPATPLPGRYEMIEVGTGSLLASWWAEAGWVDSGWITEIDLAFPESWVEVYFYPFGNEPAVKMEIVNPAPGTEYGWLARGMCHSIEIEFPLGWSPQAGRH